MNKTAIKNFAIWARNKLITDVSYHAGLLGITKNGISKALPQSTDDVEFFDIGTAEPYAVRGEAIQQRKSLVDAIQQKEKETNYETAFSGLMEEVAYTWFNRLIAVRFMEVNDYLPSHIRVLSSDSGKQEPDIVTNPFDAELSFAEAENQKIIQMKNDNKLDEVFRILFVKQCRELSKILPRLFEGTNDYTELLFSVSFIDQEGVVYHLVHDIPEEDFNVEQGGQVEIIGWLYQYYNAELKDETFALLKNNVKVTKERIPSATQLFTPDWIVRYMVENSLGRLWIEGHPNDLLKSGWKYYLDEAEQEDSVKQELEKIRAEYAKLNPENIKVIDPCMGSGHILVYAFDVLMQIYESAGYTQRDAARSILEHNLYGLDIDDRAAQLAYFAVMMKARQYNRRILDGETDCNVYAIKESNGFDREALVKLGGDLRPIAERILDTFVDAKEYGSILNVDVTLEELDALDKRLDDVGRMSDYGNLLDIMYASILCNELSVTIRQARVMVQKYNVVITNPPYMSNGGMNAKLLDFVKSYYPDSKGDMSTCFMEKCEDMTMNKGYYSMINIPVWMFQSSYEALRRKLIKMDSIISLVHFGRGVFGSDFGTTAFSICKESINEYKASYLRLFDKQGAVDKVETKERWFDERKGLHISSQNGYERIPGAPLAYWISERTLSSFDNPRIKEILKPKQGTSTGDDEKYVRLWTEINFELFSSVQKSTDDAIESGFRYFPLDKGGEYRRWYGNNEKVIRFDKTAFNELLGIGNHLPSRELYFKKGITWPKITAAKTSFRYDSNGFVFSSVGLKGFPSDENIFYCLGYLNSIVVEYYISIIAPGFSTVSGDIEKLPFIMDKEKKRLIDKKVNECVEIEKKEWDDFETSWDFKKHPLI